MKGAKYFKIIAMLIVGIAYLSLAVIGFIIVITIVWLIKPVIQFITEY